MIGCCRSLKHLKIHTQDHGALVFSQASEEKATRYGLWCLPNMPEWSKQSYSSYAETDRSRLDCTPICYHKQKGRYLLQNKVDPHSDFLEKNPVCLARYRSKYTNRTFCWPEKKQVYEIARHFGRRLSTTRKNASFVEKHALQIVIDPSLWSPLSINRR